MGIYKRQRNGKTVYRVRWEYRTDADGRDRYREKQFPTRREALAFERTITSGSAAPTRATVDAMLDVWMELHVTPQLAERTRRGYQGSITNQINPYLGSTRVDRLSASTIASWQRGMVKDGVSPATANKALRTLRAGLRWCRAHGMTDNRAIDDARTLRTSQPEQARPYTPSEVEGFANACDLLRDATLIRVAAYSGLRWGELAALEWDAVDLDAGTITVKQALDVDGSIKPPKNGTTRLVPVMEDGVAALKLWREHAPAGVRLVFPSKRGTPLGSSWHRDVLRDEERGVRARTGVHLQMHQLRDTYASLLIGAKVGDTELTLFLGHTSIQTTRRHYAQLLDARRVDVIEAANALVRRMRAAEKSHG